MIPTSLKGTRYHQAVEQLEQALREEQQAESRLEKARVFTSKRKEELNTTVIELLAEAKAKVLGPDGGK